MRNALVLSGHNGQELMQSFAQCIPAVCFCVRVCVDIIHKKQIHLYILHRIFVLFWRDAFLVLPLLNLFLALFFALSPSLSLSLSHTQHKWSFSFFFSLTLHLCTYDVFYW